MSETTRLIKTYYHSLKHKEISTIVSQLDSIAELALALLYADFVAVFYKKSQNQRYVPIAYNTKFQVESASLTVLEQQWHGLPENKSLESFYKNLTKEDTGTIISDFARQIDCKHYYQFAYTAEDNSGAVVAAYWKEQPHINRKHVEKILANLMTIVNQLMIGLDENRRLNDFSIRMSDFISLFEIPINDYSFENLTVKLIDKLFSVIPDLNYSLYLYDSQAKEFNAYQHWGENRPHLDFNNALANEIKTFDKEIDSHQATKGSWIDFSPGFEHDYSSVVVSPLVNDYNVRMYLAAYTNDINCISQNNKELLSIFSLFGGTILRDALLLKNINKSNTLLKKSSSRMADLETLAALTDMTSGLAHDFNNMIGGIIGRVQVMKMTNKDEKTQKGLDLIEKLATDGAETIKRIQEFTTGTKYKEMDQIDITSLLREYFEEDTHLWREKANAKQLKFNVSLPSHQLYISGVSADLMLVLTKLVDNAVDYADEKSTVTVTLHTSDRGIYVSVENIGPEITVKDGKKIFYPFYTSKTDQGSGMGLAVVHGVVTRHGGKISYTSENHKTVFTMSFPALDKIDIGNETSRVVKDSQNLKILVVDDDEHIRDVLTDMLTIDGYHITACHDGESALEQFDNNEFDILITDLGMPGMSGLDLAGIVHEKNPNIPIAMITGWGTQLNQDEIALKGIKVLLPKPFHLKDIKNMVSELTA